MILADKKVFEANFAAENFMIHKKMLTYYQGGMQGTTIASLATIHMMFTDIMRNPEVESANHYKMFLVYALCVVGIVCAFINTVLSTTVKIYGNAALLCEAEEDEVVQIIRAVRHKQEECAKWWIACLLLLLLQAAAWAWDSGNYPVIATETLVNVTALGLMVHFGLKTRRLFSADKNDSGPLVFKTSLFARYGGDMTNDDRQSKIEMLRSSSQGPGPGVGGGSTTQAAGSKGGIMSNKDIERELSLLRSEHRRRLKAVEWRGVLWFRNLQDTHGSAREGVFTKAYATLDNGSLLFYKNKDEFLHFTSTVEGANRCVKLLDYELESNAKKVAGLDKQGVSLNKALRSAVFGTDELSFLDNLSADFDQTSELSVHEPIFLMAEDKKTNIECLRALRAAMVAYEELQAVFAVNRGARLVNDPKSALAFLHERSTTRQIEESEKAHARQVQGQLTAQQREQVRVQASARGVSDPDDQMHLTALVSALHGGSRDLPQPAVGTFRGTSSGSGSGSGKVFGSLGRSLTLKRSASFTAAGSGSAGRGSIRKLDKKALALERQLQIRARLAAVTGRGELWTKGVTPVKSPKSYFSEVYAVLENGKLHFYKEKNNFIELGDTLAEPLNLRDFRVSEDRSTVAKLDVKSGDFSISKYVRQAVNDTDEIRSRDRIGISFDYLSALNNFKFCLKPISSRAKRAGFYGIILMAENKKSYKHWLSLFRAASACLADLDAMSVDETYKESIQFKLTLDAEELVQKNNHKIKHQVDLT